MQISIYNPTNILNICKFADEATHFRERIIVNVLAFVVFAHFEDFKRDSFVKSDKFVKSALNQTKIELLLIRQ